MAGGFWVNDFIGVGSGEGLNGSAKSVDEKYGITGLGEVKGVLGMLIEWDHDTRSIYISQEAFINTVLACFNLSDAAPLSTPMIPATRLSSADCPMSQEEKDEIAH